jgi:hypothetical protein
VVFFVKLPGILVAFPKKACYTEKQGYITLVMHSPDVGVPP